MLSVRMMVIGFGGLGRQGEIFTARLQQVGCRRPMSEVMLRVFLSLRPLYPIFQTPYSAVENSTDSVIEDAILDLHSLRD